VIGTLVTNGVVRRGIDKEGVIGIDNGALRIQPLIKPRWGRAGLSYGPYPRQNGLAFAVCVLNGHNTSQTGAVPEGLLRRLGQWLRGNGTERPLRRLKRWVRAAQPRYFPKHFLQWAISGSRYLQTTVVDENLAVGWFSGEAPLKPLEEGNALVMHATGPECGELWARFASGTLRSVRGVQNVPMYYLVVLRERGAAYYAGSLPNVPGFQSFPKLTPIGVDTSATDPAVFAGLHQSVSGQIGFRVDTRVYRSQVAVLSTFREWFGSAIGADRLTGEGSLVSASAAVGGRWKPWEGSFCRASEGVDCAGPAAAILELPEPAGLVHAVMTTGSLPVDGLRVLFRALDSENYWAFELGTSRCSLLIKEDGVLTRTPATTAYRLAPNAENSIQITDDGEAIRLTLNGELVYGAPLFDRRLSSAAGAGIASTTAMRGARICQFEAHPRSLRLPEPLDMPEPWGVEGGTVLVGDDFDGPAGNLLGRQTPTGAATWRRAVGVGEIQLTGAREARVRATAQDPCPGRTAYSVPWPEPDFADVSVRITPPGGRSGIGERGRGGVILWQDADNHITISVWEDDSYGRSISAFFRRDGYEEIYDAVWTNIGGRIQRGVPYQFRVVTDGTRFTAFVNGEPVLHRGLSDIYPDWERMRIHEVGLVANWEWGTDTGSSFGEFFVRGRK
jgi:hypothetical protein